MTTPPTTTPTTTTTNTTTAETGGPPLDRGELAATLGRVRAFTEALARPLAPEDQVVQTMPDVSPTKWHLAHTSWFFETFVLPSADPAYEAFDPAYATLFNSYYNGVGEQWPRPRRGLLSRPTVAEILGYRRHVDDALERLLASGPEAAVRSVAPIIELGINHEEQHQELLLTDCKHVLGSNPLLPTYRETAVPTSSAAPALRWVDFDEGPRAIGHDDRRAFAFDNERPRHEQLLRPFALASRPATCGEWLAFIDDGGYDRPELWLADGWTFKNEAGWRAPLHWHERDGDWVVFTLGGPRPLDLDAPVAHVSLYEADAFASWSDARLPAEAELETAALAVIDASGGPAAALAAANLVERDALHPSAAWSADDEAPAGLHRVLGDVWEWTSSPYAPYPGFRPFAGALGEYNGKFMCNQLVLRGGSCLTSARHLRPTYRNFFYPKDRWQMTGVRLARDPR